MPCGQHGHQAGLRRRQRLVAEADPARVDVAHVQHQQREVEHEARDGDAQKIADLHVARSASEQVAHLEVLKHLAGHGRRDAHHRRHAEHRCHAAGTGNADGHHEQRRHDQGGKGQPGDRVIGGPDHAHQIARHCREEESQHDHDRGRQDASCDPACEDSSRARSSRQVGDGQSCEDVTCALRSSLGPAVGVMAPVPAALASSRPRRASCPPPGSCACGRAYKPAPTSMPPTAMGRTMKRTKPRVASAGPRILRRGPPVPWRPVGALGNRAAAAPAAPRQSPLRRSSGRPGAAR
jgi:hypothetical protein